MTAKSFRRVYGEGYFAAISRETEKDNPYKKGTVSAGTWLKGYQRGVEVIADHRASLKKVRAATDTTWYGDHSHEERGT